MTHIHDPSLEPKIVTIASANMAHNQQIWRQFSTHVPNEYAKVVVNFFIERFYWAMQVAEGSPPIYVEYLVPLLTRLAAIKYSVIATGFHCQWHAKVITKMAASIAFFVDPACIPAEHMSKVSMITYNLYHVIEPAISTAFIITVHTC